MSQKIENILNLALESTPEERARSSELDVGYDVGERAWDLIIKYSGSLDAAREISESVTELLNNYAVVLPGRRGAAGVLHRCGAGSAL